MPKSKTVALLSGLVESDIDDELDSATPEAPPTPESNHENNVAPARKGRRKTKAAGARFTRAKAAARRVSGDAAVIKKKAAPKKKVTGKREPLKEQTNIQHESDTEEVDGFEAQGNEVADPIENGPAVEEVKKPAKQKPAAKGRKQAKGQKQRAESGPDAQNKTTERDGEFEYTPTVSRQNKVSVKPVGATEKITAGRPQAPKEIPETQAEPMDVDPSSLPDDEDAIPQSVYHQTSNFRAHSTTRQPSLIRRRAGSASDTERTGSDPAVRRKLGDLTKKCDNLELKYNNLREVGIKEAEINFERLKAQSEANTRGTALLHGFSDMD